MTEDHSARIGKLTWGDSYEEYLREGELEKAEKTRVWQTAIGLQAVDGLFPSKYLVDTAGEHIDGELGIDDVQDRILSYYEARTNHTQAQRGEMEADIVSARIAKILGEKAFRFSPMEWKSIHQRLFCGLFDQAGEYRPYNITKREWVLGGETVLYAPWSDIARTVEYDFDAERRFSYKGLSRAEVVSHVARFTSGIWQIHPFVEGNTRSTAVFLVKYLNFMGFSIDNEPFRESSWFFRNALVRANYSNYDRGVFATCEFLELFFDNLLFGADHELRNRLLRVDAPEGGGYLAESAAATTAGDVGQTDDGTERASERGHERAGRLLSALGGEELSAKELMARLQLKSRPTFLYNYLQPALEAGLIERTIPDKPNSRSQKYRARKR